MGKYDLEHACGHPGQANLRGATQERQRKLEYIQSKDCPECRNSRAAAANAAAGFPALEGTQRQTSWAESIRKRLIDAGATEQETQHHPALAALTQIQEASWWIENRRKNAAELLEAIALQICPGSEGKI